MNPTPQTPWTIITPETCHGLRDLVGLLAIAELYTEAGYPHPYKPANDAWSYA